MKHQKQLWYIIILFFSLCFISCSSLVYKEAYPTLIDGKYDSEFPYRGCSAQLEEISESIKYVNCIAYYKIYIFNKGAKVTKQTLSNTDLNNVTSHIDHTQKTAAGTATVIYSKLDKVALITSAHIINFLDTLYSYQSDSTGNYTRYLNGILVKERQDIYVPDLPEGGDLKILCKDDNLDVAILGQEFKKSVTIPVKTFNYSFGKARELEWGSFVYLFGYPMGYKTLTKALVSSPNRDKNGAFIIDANLNEGFSGGIILAIKDGVPNFELVGMVKAMFADYEYVLKPSNEYDYSKHNPLFPYSGELYIDKRTNVKYGLARVIPVESIIEFIYNNRVLLNSMGYDFAKILDPYL